MKFLPLVGAMALASFAAPVASQSLVPQCRNAGGAYVPCVPSILVDKTGTVYDGSNPVPVTSAKGPAPAASSQSVVPASDAQAFPTKSTDGADATVGSTADAPWTGAGVATLVSVLKALYLASQGSTPGGTATIGNVGGVQTPGSLAIGGGSRIGVVDSAGLYQDLKGDTNGLFMQGLGPTGQPAKGFPLRLGGTDTTGNTQSLKTDTTGWLYALPYGQATLVPPTAATAAAKVPLWLGRYGQIIGGYSDGTADYYAAGNANGAYMQGAAPSGTPNLGNPLQIGFSDGANNQRAKGNPATGAIFTEEQARTAYFAETSTPLAANATFIGAVHDAGGSILGNPTRWGTFGCFVRSDQQVTMTIRASNDNGSFFTAATPVVVSANTSTYLAASLFSRYWRCEITNGSTAQTSMNANTRFGL